MTLSINLNKRSIVMKQSVFSASRRAFLQGIGLSMLSPALVSAAPFLLPSSEATSGQRQIAAARPPLLILLELKGGNDGLNTWVPFGDPAYAALRPRLALTKEQVIPVTDTFGLHTALAPLLPLWTQKEMAILQGVGYPDPNLSHFRSIEIWETASKSQEYLAEGWLARALQAQLAPSTWLSDGVILNSPEIGPLLGGKLRVLNLSKLNQFARNKMAFSPQVMPTRNPALAHLLQTEAEIQHAMQEIQQLKPISFAFPKSALGQSLATLTQLLANELQFHVAKVTLNGFDTHRQQAGTHQRLLTDLAEGLVAFKTACVQMGIWQRLLIVTYSEFGRRPAENGSQGTDHGTANVHFAFGGAVKGGLYGTPPSLTQLKQGNLVHTLDFRSIYVTILEKWFGMKQHGLGFAPLSFLA